MRGKPRHDSSKCSIINKTVSFNVLNEYERQLLEYVESWTNVSGAIKRLIAADMTPVREMVPAVPTTYIELTPTVEPVTNDPTEDWDPVSELF